MITIDFAGRTLQRAVCLFTAAIIVTAGLTLGAVAAHSLERAAIAAIQARA